MLSSAKALEMDFEFFLRTVRTETKTFSQVREHLATKANDIPEYLYLQKGRAVIRQYTNTYGLWRLSTE